DVVEGRGVGGGVGGETVERGVHDTLEGVALSLREDGHHAGEDGRGEAGAAGDGEVLAGGVAEAGGAGTRLTLDPCGLITCAVGIGGVVGGGIEGDVRHEAAAGHAGGAAARWGDAGDAGLPRRRCSEDAGAASAGRERVLGKGCGVVVPGLLRYVRERGGHDVRASGCGEVLVVGGGDGSGGELGAADRCDEGTGRGEIDGEAVGLRHGGGGGGIEAVGRTVVTGCGDNRLALRGGLLQKGVEGV